MSTLFVVGCQVVGGFEDFSAEGGAGGSAGGSASGTGGSTSGTGGSTSGTGGTGGGDPASCPPVPAGDEKAFTTAQRKGKGACFLIMRHEVSTGEYLDKVPVFEGLGGCVGPARPQCEEGCPASPAACSDDLRCSCPFCTNRVGCEDVPVTCVANCGAIGFCKAIGARLCKIEELIEACADSGVPEGSIGRTYPYGYVEDYEEQVCIDDGSLPDFVTAESSCVTPDGVYDLVGNVAEWADCSAMGPLSSNCPIAGALAPTPGDVPAENGSGLTCSSMLGSRRDERRPDLGFRCCKDL